MINEYVVYAKDYAEQRRSHKKIVYLCPFNLLFTFSTHWKLVSASINLFLTVSLLRLPSLFIEIFVSQTSTFILLILSLEATSIVTPSRNLCTLYQTFLVFLHL